MEQSTGRTDPYWSVSRLVNRLELIMRIRFVSYLGMGIISAFLIVSSYAFTEGTFKWLAFVGGIALAVIGAIGFLSSRRRALT